MIAVENHTIKYFRAPKDHFWHWTENGTLIQWANGSTICYRDDLFALLKQVNSGLPPLSPLLLLLTACARPLQMQDIALLFSEVKKFTGNDESSQLHKTLKYTLKFLEIVTALPENLRTGQKRVHLIYEVFTGASFTFDNQRLRDAIDELNSGRMDKDVYHYFSEPCSEGDFINCLLYFCTALQKYPTLQSLTVKLRTGLDEIPTAIPDLLPETETGSLYDRLLQDPQTAGLARLSKRLEAALNIPMQSKGSSDQPFGGISDITNRGNYDKLLLSELAHDDELLMARLVNNEALYFRREEPPQHPKMQRIILIDTTLKMWGTARVFALAAALACAQQNKHVELMGTFTLGGNTSTSVSLNSKHGVIQALEMLDPDLHCGTALEALVASLAATAGHEFIFITHARLLHHPAFYVHFASIKHLLSFIVTVTDTGELQLFECINGISKLISHAKIDVDELLSTPKTQQAKRTIGDVPAFLTQKPSPLYYPHIRIKPVPEKMFIPAGLDGGAVVISETQRVMLTVSKDRGLIELLSFIEKGVYTIGVDSNKEVNILVSNPLRKLLKLYKIRWDDLQSLATELPFELGDITRAAFKENKFYIESATGAFIYDCIASVIVQKKAQGSLHNMITETAQDQFRLFSKYEFNRFFDPFSNVFYRVKNVHINTGGKLVLGKHELIFSNLAYISFKNNQDRIAKNKEATLTGESQNFLQNKNLGFNVWTWNDGSEAIIDPRGLLHLRSSDKSLPEITIVMILGRTTTCWASDNNSCGYHYYITEKSVTVLTAEKFYNNYIQKFIDRIGQ